MLHLECFFRLRELKDETNVENSSEVFKRIKDFPFYNDLEELALQKGIKLSDLLNNHVEFASFVLEKSGLGYDDLPKGLVPFYKNSKEELNAFQMHLQEADKISNGKVHFTVSGDYLDRIKSSLSSENASFSLQNKSSNYIALSDEEVARDVNGDILLRPSGHGALLSNLQKLEADIVFIKNIDNI